jgi:hypothetical protein
MRFASLSRSRFALLALPFVVVACGQSRPDARAASATHTEVAAQAPSTAHAHAAVAGDAAELPVIHIYKTPTCGCCGDWVDHVEQAGFRTEVQDLPNLTAIKQRTGVPQHLASCHTSLVGDYVVEGHVPASTIRRLLAEKPAIAGIAVPGMPIGSPGMEHGDHKDPYDVIAFTRDGRGMVYESH